jgi:hypothetical protein
LPSSKMPQSVIRGNGKLPHAVPTSTFNSCMLIPTRRPRSTAGLFDKNQALLHKDGQHKSNRDACAIR